MREYRFSDGSQLEIVELPLPDPIYLEGDILAASYANFLISNGWIFVPQFNQKEQDSQALKILGECFPKSKIVGVDCRLFLHEGGAIHCLSQQEPM